MQIQYRFNERLLAVTKIDRPVAFTDVADLAGSGNVPVNIPAVALLVCSSLYSSCCVS